LTEARTASDDPRSQMRNRGASITDWSDVPIWHSSKLALKVGLKSILSLRAYRRGDTLSASSELLLYRSEN